MCRRGEIEGVKVQTEFLILREGWEMDNWGWITADGKVYTTSHGGRLYEMRIEELESHIEETERSLFGLHLALAALTP